jgi:ankyrin repeat protein
MESNKLLFKLLKTNDLESFKDVLNSDPTIDVNIRDENNNYLLTHAVNMANVTIIQLLIDRGSRLDIIDNDDRSILYIPIDRGLDNILELLLRLGKLMIGIPAIDIGDKNNNIPLHYAINKKNINAVKLLLQYGSNVNVVDKQGFNALHLSVKTRSVDICKLVINAGANINTRFETGETSLHIACNFQLEDIIELLIKNGIDVNIQDYDHEFTSLHYATNLNNKNIVKILLEHGANQNFQDIYGNTPLHYAITEGGLEIFEMLVKNTKHRVNLNLWNITGKIPLHILFESSPYRINDYIDLILNGSNINLQEGEDGNTCLHYLCKSNLWKEYGDILKNKKMDIFISNKSLKRPVEYVNKNDIETFVDMVSQSYIIRLRTTNNIDWKHNWENLCTKELHYNNLSIENKQKILEENTEINESIISIKNNDICQNIIKTKLNYFIKNPNKSYSIASFPQKRNRICLVLTEGTPVKFCTFTGSTLDILLGLIYLLDKHKNSCSTLDKNFTENKDLCKFYKSIGIIVNSKCEFLNFEIVWVQYKLHLVENFQENFNECLKKSNKRFVILPIGIELREGSHANYLIYDKKLNEIERFEPHGATIPIGLNYNATLFDNLLESRFKNIMPGITYIRPSDFLPKIGFQLMDVTENRRKQISDPGGFCALWAIWYVDMRITFSDIPRTKLVNKIIKTMRRNNISFKNMIRNYASNIIAIRDKILDKAGLDINDWLNDQHTNEQLQIIINEITNKITSTSNRI